MATPNLPAEAIEAAIQRAARAIQAYQCRDAHPAEQYTWAAIPEQWRQNHLAAARVMVEAAAPILVEAGRDQAMAGAAEQWGVRYPDGYTVQVVDEQTARAWAADHEPYGTRPGPPVAVWRTAWAEPEQGGQR